MKYIFWSATFLVAYTYLGYPLWLWMRACLRPRPVKRGSEFPTVSVVVVVHNEELTLPAKIENLCGLDYPVDRIHFVIVSDGSTDATNRIISGLADARFRALLLPECRGKAFGLQQALKVCTGEVVVFTDARQIIERGAVRALVENFADESVGCASGELMLGEACSGELSRGMGLYWRIEKRIRIWESVSGSVVGASGALYAARRELLTPPLPETILDDVFIPMHIVGQGARVIFDGRARAWDKSNLGEQREFARKVRTLTGNYQLLQLAPWLLTRQNPIRFEFISHKLLRLVVPFALAAILVSSFLLDGGFYRGVGVLQITFYAIAMLGFLGFRRSALAKISEAACTFVVLNAAAVVAFRNFLTGRKVAWS